MIHVLDACAMLAYLHGEPGGTMVDTLLRDTSRSCSAHSVNLCEVYYDLLRRADAATADAAIRDLREAGVVERDDLDPPFWKSVGTVKSLGRISLADSFCIALAQRLVGEVVTSDHREFDPLVPRGLCAIQFIR